MVMVMVIMIATMMVMALMLAALMTPLLSTHPLHPSLLQQQLITAGRLHQQFPQFLNELPSAGGCGQGRPQRYLIEGCQPIKLNLAGGGVDAAQLEPLGQIGQAEEAGERVFLILKPAAH